MKKILSIVLAAATAVSVMAGCSKGETGSQAGSGTGTGAAATSLTYWYWADNSSYSAKMQEIVKNFNANNKSKVKVTAQEYPWDGGAYSQNLFTAAMGGGGPDIATFKLTSTPQFTANKLLANLDSYISKWSEKDDIDKSLYDIMKQASGTSSIYIMPWNTQVLYVYYRPSMFKAAGVSVPKTYDEFLAACKKLTRDTNGDGKTDVYGFSMRGSKGGQEPWGSFIQARGGDFTNFASPEAIAGMQDFINLYKNHYAPPTAPSDGFNETVANFKSGKAAMVIHHIGSAADMVKTLGNDVDAFVFPAGKKQWTSLGDTENVVFDKCQNKDAAFEFVAYMATGKGQETWCTATGNVPVSKRVQKLPAFQNNKFMKVSIAGQPHAGIFPVRDTTTDWINTVWPNTVAAALSGKTTAAGAMQTLQKGLYGK
jgi:multiple sugar transport system substrate-binding protein